MSECGVWFYFWVVAIAISPPLSRINQCERLGFLWFTLRIFVLEFQWSSLFVDVSVAGMFEGYLVNDSLGATR